MENTVKLANNKYPIEDVLRRRWSTVAYSDRPVEKEKLLSLFEAARWAPSSANEQPWYFLIATKDDAESYARMLECLVPANVEWASRAPVLMLSVAKLHRSNGAINRHAFHDVGLAVGCMLVQATSLGLCVHQMGGFYIDKARTMFEIPDTHEPVAAIAIGYLGSVEGLPEHLRQRELTARTRKEISSFVYTGKWGKPAF
ncbi:MAG: nitroreductase family protein [Acidobacteriota bacterium]|nr:nitroreductase family protein [Blastocatellia bacterium]MDW8412414.1 nitroreductase family protein [Acidobacteriota bacterium]